MTLDELAQSPNLGWWLLGGVCAVLLLWRVGVHLRRTLRGWRRGRRQSRARRGEQRAGRLLARQGWEVVDEQTQRTWTVHMDDEPVEITLRVDYLVERGDERAVAEVKTGAEAPSLRYAATRRQMLEYRVAFEVDTVLLVDAERDTVHRVEFG